MSFWLHGCCMFAVPLETLGGALVFQDALLGPLFLFWSRSDRNLESPIIGASNVCLNFRYIALFQNKGNSCDCG